MKGINFEVTQIDTLIHSICRLTCFSLFIYVANPLLSFYIWKIAHSPHVALIGESLFILASRKTFLSAELEFQTRWQECKKNVGGKHGCKTLALSMIV